VHLRAGRRILELQEHSCSPAKVRDQATHDGLTGLLNRDTILDALRTELAAPPASVTPWPCSWWISTTSS